MEELIVTNGTGTPKEYHTIDRQKDDFNVLPLPINISDYRGRFSPDGHKEHFVLNYTSEEDETAQLTHHTPGENQEMPCQS